MYTVTLIEPLEVTIELYRAALSARDTETRIKALRGVKAHMEVWQMSGFQASDAKPAGTVQPNIEMFQSRVEYEVERMANVTDLQLVLAAYDAGDNKRLAFAEAITLEIWLSIVAGQNLGVHSDKGAIARASATFRAEGVRGGRDLKTLRSHWKKYKGVAHFGAALKFADLEGYDLHTAVKLADKIRFAMSHECPKSTNKPYVSEDEQVKFVL